MPVYVHETAFRRLSAEELAFWRAAEAAPVSDCLERGMAMGGDIQPLDPSMRLVGQARTVRCMAADNGALHAALTIAEPGDVLVADAGGYLGNAVWGGLMTAAAQRRGIAGLVVDGVVRDRDEIVAAPFPCYARGCAPAGPHKLFGGAVDGPISCGGVVVRAGDLIVADADGVAVVPIERLDATAAAYRALKEKEARVRAALDEGGALGEIYGAPDIVRV